MTRINQITSPDGLSEAQREVFDRIANGVRKGVRGPHTVLLHNPELAARVESLGRYVRYDCAVPQRLRELAILVVSVHWKARYEWYAHSPLALEQGIREEVQSVIASGGEPSFDNSADRIVFLVVRELLRKGTIEAALFEEVEQLLTPQGVIDLTALVGYYTMLAFTLNVFEVEPPDLSSLPF